METWVSLSVGRLTLRSFTPAPLLLIQITDDATYNFIHVKCFPPS